MRQAREMLEKTLNLENAEPLFATSALERIVTLGNRGHDHMFSSGGHIACAQARGELPGAGKFETNRRRLVLSFSQESLARYEMVETVCDCLAAPKS